MTTDFGLLGEKCWVCGLPGFLPTNLRYLSTLGKEAAPYARPSDHPMTNAQVALDSEAPHFSYFILFYFVTAHCQQVGEAAAWEFSQGSDRVRECERVGRE